MTNPDNIVRVRARNGGRASVYEANGWAQAYTSGLVEGNGVIQNTSADMHVLVGGSATKPDVVLAENPAGYKIALDLVGQQAITITTPASNSRISAIVAYTDDLAIASSQDTITGSPASCGLIVVNGTASSSPTEPTDNQIRTAITADGATGSQAAYCVIATILVASDATTITDSLITMKLAQIGSPNIDFATMGVNCVMNKSNGKNVSVSITPKISGGIIEIEAVTGYTWGYGGGTITYELNKPSGLTRDSYHIGSMSGGDTTGRQMITNAIYSGAKAGTTYTFSASVTGNTGATPDTSIIARYYPGS